jgi:hypothetical protein
MTDASMVALVKVEEAVERACQAIYAEFDGYWPSDLERARIAVALLAEHLPPHRKRLSDNGGSDDA